MYPSNELIEQWKSEWPATDMPLMDFIARKACDWQRSRDAEVCDAGAAVSPNKQIAAGCARCANAIREAK